MSAFGGKADVIADPSACLLIAISGHSPPSGVDTNVHFVIGIEFDAQVHFYSSRKKDAAGGTCNKGQGSDACRTLRRPNEDE